MCTEPQSIDASYTRTSVKFGGINNLNIENICQ